MQATPVIISSNLFVFGVSRSLKSEHDSFIEWKYRRSSRALDVAKWKVTVGVAGVREVAAGRASGFTCVPPETQGGAV
jgi:hypothetical protein